MLRYVLVVSLRPCDQKEWSQDRGKGRVATLALSEGHQGIKYPSRFDKHTFFAVTWATVWQFVLALTRIIYVQVHESHRHVPGFLSVLIRI